MRKYYIDLKKWHLLISDKESASFHAQNNDYFGTLATIISLLEQNDKLQKKDYKKILNNLKEDLIYLQKNFKIEKK
ncbi:MAG: hypothetical protein K9M44_04870 [Candidatus Pacebacteria bacterium]|nr:hypothetical protein [Candidatus Paceibacterota bacterium]